MTPGKKAWETRRRNEANEILTLGETAAELGISYPTLHTHLEEVKPAPKKMGKRYFFARGDLPALGKFFQEESPPDSPANKAWKTRRKNEQPHSRQPAQENSKPKQEKRIVLSAYLASLAPNATPGIKAKASRLLNELCERRAADGKNPNMVRAGIRAQASRILAQ